MVVGGAGSALADPAEPTNYRSTVTAVEPQSDSASFGVVGGDAFLEIVVTAGHDVQIPGYYSEPYVRIEADGSVWENRASPSFYLNDDRYGQTPIPEGIDAGSEPRWEQVATDGRYAWHDHRIHWMSADLPPTVSGVERQRVFPWELPVVIDGREAILRGELEWLPSQSPVLPLLIGLVALIPLTVRWRRSPVVLAGGLVLASVAALGIEFAQYTGTPPGARAFPSEVVLPVVGLAIGGTLLGRRGRIDAASWMMGGGGLALLGWGLRNLEVLWLPVLPSAIAPLIERSGVAAVLWVGGGVFAVWATDLVRKLRPAT